MKFAAITWVWLIGIGMGIVFASDHKHAGPVTDIEIVEGEI